MQEIKPLTDKHTEAKKACAKVGDKIGEQRETQKFFMAYRERGLNPLSAAGWGFLPAIFLMSFFFAIQGIVAANVPGLTTGGILWLTDLTEPDPKWIMPGLSTLGFLAAFKAGMNAQVTAPNEMLSKAIIPLAAVGFYFSTWFPAVCQSAVANVFPMTFGNSSLIRCNNRPCSSMPFHPSSSLSSRPSSSNSPPFASWSVSNLFQKMARCFLRPGR